MTITVLFFASLREKIGKSKIDIDCADQGMSIAEVWKLATNELDLPNNIKVSVNQHYVDFNGRACVGDEVAFFPPVTGG